MAYEIEEFHIRKWFCSVELEQALDTFRVVEGILQARKEAQPVVKAPRKQRSDKGKARTVDFDGAVNSLLGEIK